MLLEACHLSAANVAKELRDFGSSHVVCQRLPTILTSTFFQEPTSGLLGLLQYAIGQLYLTGSCATI
eukprot:scaffold5752_cov120-Cylindrotheca_fusiformis.AAC.6